MKKGAIGELKDADWFNRIQQIKEIQYIIALDIDKLKSRENLIF
jgi:hypothetical protein